MQGYRKNGGQDWKESHESEGEGQGREAVRNELRRGRRRLRGAEGCVGRDLGIHPLL